MAVADSPWKSVQDSPSRQLLWELSRLALAEQQESYGRLDRESREREVAHNNALAVATARHDKVRKDAEAERDRHERREQQERARRAEEARQHEERLRQAEAERERAERKRMVEEAEAAARAERAATQEREAEKARMKDEKDRRNAQATQAAQAAQARKQEQEAAERKKALEEGKAREAALAATARPSPNAQPVVSAEKASGPTISQKTTRDPVREAEHQRYLEIHRTLKEVRKFMLQQGKQNPKLKEKMGDMRREIRKSVGQLREGKGKNTAQVRAQTVDLLIDGTKPGGRPFRSTKFFEKRSIHSPNLKLASLRWSLVR